MTDHEIAKHLDSKQYGTIHDKRAGYEAVRRMLVDLERLARQHRESNPHLKPLADRLDSALLWRKAFEMAVAELDHDGYPETAREFADVLKQMRSLERR